MPDTSFVRQAPGDGDLSPGDGRAGDCVVYRQYVVPPRMCHAAGQATAETRRKTARVSPGGPGRTSLRSLIESLISPLVGESGTARLGADPPPTLHHPL
jgi:hypothetical protein